MPRLATFLALALVAGALLPLAAVEAEDQVRSPFLASDGTLSALFAPEFQDAPGLLEDLGTFALAGLDARLIGPLVPAPEAGKPPVPSRLLLRGTPEVVAEAREVLLHLDVPAASVAVSLLAAEVLSTTDRERGGSLLFDRDRVEGSPETLFRGGFGNYEPESYLRSSLTNTIPFHGASIFFGNSESDWTQNGVFEMVLRMLQTQRQVEVLAWPTVVCTEGEPGLIESIVKRPDRLFVTSGDRVFVRGRTQVGGIVLTVIPVRVSRAGAVLDLVADIGVLVPEDPANVPASNWMEVRRKVATRVTIRDRESILIGGLKMRRRLHEKVGDPVFGKIPGVDVVASASDTEFLETELILLLRARVLVPASPVGITLPPGEARRLQRAANARPGELGVR